VSNAPLVAPYRLEYPYRRHLGPVLGAFFSALKRGEILGVRSAAGILVPPSEYDPISAAPLAEMVPLDGSGTVGAYTWIASPQPHHPLATPFAFGRIRLDGACSDWIHAIDAPQELLTAGRLRVAPRWATPRRAAIGAIEAFVPLAQARPAQPQDDEEPVTSIRTPIRLDYLIRAGLAQSQFLSALAERRIVGLRSPVTQKVLLPPRGVCPTSGAPCNEPVPLSSHGTVTSFSVVRITFEGQRLTPPYACAAILLDGADTPMLHLIGGDPDQVRTGLRVRAVWAETPQASLAMIRHFLPIDAPDDAPEEG
jgi:uncharacterized OB-fold protein